MDALITASELDSLLKKTTPYSQRELMQMASFSFPSLAERLDGLSYSEKSSVLRIEGENLYHYFGACRVAIGADEKGLNTLLSLYNTASMISQIKSIAAEESSTKIEENEMYCILIVKMILSNCDAQFRVKIQGQVPQKLFSFRQTTADEWFSTITGYYTKITSRVLSLNGINAAAEFLFMQCAWHMHHSQPNKYQINSVDRSILLDLAKQFITEFGK